MSIIVKRVRAPVRIDFAGGTTDIYPFTHTHGGAVLNAAINRYVEGKIIKTPEKVHLEYTGNTPTSSGLGTSGVMNLVWLALISQIKMNKKGGISFKTKTELAEKVYGLEQAMGLVGGKQDQYAAAFGGINFLEFKKDRVNVVPVKLNKKFIRELEKRLVLVYMGKPHFSGDSNKLMIDNLKKGRNTKNLLKIKEIAIDMKKALLKKDVYKFAELLNMETRERDKLHHAIIGKTTEKHISKGLKNGAIAAKVCGSGGGGSVLFFVENRKKILKTFKRKIIDFKFDFKGLQWV
jgi:D-glycero-alpha-D-manno-heptose-7-phosphate kinase